MGERRSSRPAAIRAALALFGPPSGPCALCGLPDRRHRTHYVDFRFMPAAEPPDALRDAAQALIDAISAAEATGWTWAGGAEWVSVDDPDYRLPSEMQTAQGALAAALVPKP